MITLIILGYIVVSLLVALSFSCEYIINYAGQRVYPTGKESLIVGFAFIPAILTIIGIIIGAILLACYMVLGIYTVCMWIVNNLP